MKWKCNGPYNGKKRVIKRFLFLPRCINDECRWLCVAKIKQYYEFNYAWNGWVDDCFVD